MANIENEKKSSEEDKNEEERKTLIYGFSSAYKRTHNAPELKAILSRLRGIAYTSHLKIKVSASLKICSRKENTFEEMRWR